MPSAADEKKKADEREPREKLKNDPKHVAMARELRDRWLEAVNSEGADAEMLTATGKYDVSRTVLPRSRETAIGSDRLLPAA